MKINPDGASSSAALIVVYLSLILSVLTAAGCGSAAKAPAAPVSKSFEKPVDPVPTPAEPALSGASYVVGGKRYHLLADGAGHTEEGLGAWYGGGRFQGRKTASGERFDQNKLTAAHRTLPFNTRVEVRNPANGKTVVVRVNDRGPFHNDYVIDLSRAAAVKIGLLSSGPVTLRVVGGPAPGD